MQGNLVVPLELVFDSGESNFHGLDLYYGADSIGGFAEAIALTTHAIVNEEMVKQTPSVKGFSLDFKNSFVGSFRQKIELEFNGEESIRVIKYIGLDAYVELLKLHLRIPMGGSTKLELKKARQWYKQMKHSEDLLDRLKRPLERIHHPVTGQGYNITLKKHKTPLLLFNKTTSNYLSAETKSPDTKIIEVAVSRFNARRGTGRFIEEEDSESISFSPKSIKLMSRGQKNALADSLKRLANDDFHKLKAVVTEVLAFDGRVKHYILHSVDE
ncbi:hypothetical protein D3C77_170560 [compost metagenome]